MTGARVWPQPLIVSRDVEAASRFYCEIFGFESAHGGDEYDQLLSDGELVLQLHDFGADEHHGPLADSELPAGNGMLLWFEVADVDAVAERVHAAGAEIVRELVTNPNAKQLEIWFRDPDGYTVVAAGPSEYRPR